MAKNGTDFSNFVSPINHPNVVAGKYFILFYFSLALTITDEKSLFVLPMELSENPSFHFFRFLKNLIYELHSHQLKS